MPRSVDRSGLPVKWMSWPTCSAPSCRKNRRRSSRNSNRWWPAKLRDRPVLAAARRWADPPCRVRHPAALGSSDRRSNRSRHLSWCVPSRLATSWRVEQKARPLRLWAWADPGPPGPPGPGGPGAPGGFGPGMFLAPAFLAELDRSEDGTVTREELESCFRQWFDAWNTEQSDTVTVDQVRAGLNEVLSPFRHAPPGGFPFGPPEGDW